MQRLLVTGGSGFLGRRITEYYHNQYEILAPTHQELDITCQSSVTNFFQSYGPDLVIHCAAISDVGRCEKEPELAHLINVESSVSLAKAAASHKSKCLLCSSDQVYFGSSLPGPHREDESLTPGNVYGRGKKEAEERCLDVNPDAVLLRLSWMYDSRTLQPAEHSDFIRTLIPKLRSSQPLVYPIFDRRGITNVREVIANLEPAFSLPGGVYNFGAPNDLTTYETLRSVFLRLGLDPNRIQPNEQAFASRPRDITMNQEKLNGYGIRFSSTEQGIWEILKAAGFH